MPRTSLYRSAALPLNRVREAIAAHNYATAIGRPLCFALDIHWAWTRIGNDGVYDRRKAVSAILESQRHWLANHGVGFFSILVREAPPGSALGEHAHQLIHVPLSIQAAFLKQIRVFLRGKRRHQKRALDWARTYSDGKLAYILKGCTPPSHQILASMFKSEYERNKFVERAKGASIQGVIQGKRLFISQALGPKARADRSQPIHVVGMNPDFDHCQHNPISEYPPVTMERL